MGISKKAFKDSLVSEPKIEENVTSGQKSAVSLLITVILFAAFCVFAFSGFFYLLDSRFYQPAKISQVNYNLEKISDAYDEYLDVLNERFYKADDSFVKNSLTYSFFEPKPSAEEQRQREKALGDLFSQTQGLSGIRMLGSNGVSIHYSSFKSDVLKRTSETVSYKNYPDSVTYSGQKEIPQEKIAARDSITQQDDDGYVIFFDSRDSRLIFSYPVYDAYSVFRGSAVFYVDAGDFNRFLVRQNLISLSGGGKLIASDSVSGYVFGIPSVANSMFDSVILEKWEHGIFGVERLFSYAESSGQVQKEQNSEVEPDDRLVFDLPAVKEFIEGKSDSDRFWVMVTGRKCEGGYISWILSDDLFTMPHSVQMLILVCMFISAFLIIFLLLNLRREDSVVIRERIRTLQIGVVNEYLKKKETADWNVIAGKITRRREDVTKEIIKSLGRRGKKNSGMIKELIDRSWDELLTAMSVQQKENGTASLTGENAAEIKALLQEILSKGVQAAAITYEKPAPVPPVKRPAPVEELEEVPEAEAVEELEEVPEAEAVEELEEVPEAEAVEELEEVPEAKAVEELGEVPEAEAVEELEEVPEAEAVEELEEVPEAEHVDEDAAEIVEAISEAEAVEELEEVPEAEAVEELGEVPEAEAVEELEEVPEAEAVEELEEVPEAEPVDEDAAEIVEEISEAEAVEQLERIDDEAIVKQDDGLIGNMSGSDSDSQDEILGFGSVAMPSFSNTEDDVIIDNFKAGPLDFTNLDTQDSEVKQNGLLSKAISLEQDIPLADFDMRNEETDDLKEILNFSSQIPESAENNSTPVTEVEYFVDDIRNPSFEILDRKPVSVEIPDRTPKQEKLLYGEKSIDAIQAVKNTVYAESRGNVEDALPLKEDAAKGRPFTLTKFGANNNSITDLPSSDNNVIKLDDKGIYYIPKNVSTKGVVQDTAFRRLVESVLHV